MVLDPQRAAGDVRGPMNMNGMSMGHAAGGNALNLLPEWLGIVGVAVFLLIAGSHLLHLLSSSGERRWWHVTHVSMAIGMASMYLPAALDPFAISSLFWQFLFAAVAAAVGLRVVAGFAGRASDNPLWALTAIELGTMVYMWSSGSLLPAVTWALIAYLVLEASLWAVNAYRAIDGDAPLFRWTALAPATEGGPVLVAGVATESLIGGLDISVSMTAMALGMAYMLAALQLMT
jgi:hypothetical protein